MVCGRGRISVVWCISIMFMIRIGGRGGAVGENGFYIKEGIIRMGGFCKIRGRGRV